MDVRKDEQRFKYVKTAYKQDYFMKIKKITKNQQEGKQNFLILVR